MKCVGSFTIESGEVLITDPGYDRDTWCAIKLENVERGKWNAFIEESFFGKWGSRVTKIVAMHDKILSLKDKPWELLDTDIGVDSGQAGFFDWKYYGDEKSVEYVPNHTADWDNSMDNVWYKQCCEITLDNKYGVIPYGVVTRSGFGDGIYDAYICTEPTTDKIVAMMIVFLTEDDIKEWKDLLKNGKIKAKEGYGDNSR